MMKNILNGKDCVLAMRFKIKSLEEDQKKYLILLYVKNLPKKGKTFLQKFFIIFEEIYKKYDSRINLFDYKPNNFGGNSFLIYNQTMWLCSRNYIKKDSKNNFEISKKGENILGKFKEKFKDNMNYQELKENLLKVKELVKNFSTNDITKFTYTNFPNLVTKSLIIDSIFSNISDNEILEIKNKWKEINENTK